MIDGSGHYIRRSLNFTISSFITPEYELVAIHPEHFLPRGSVFMVYDPSTQTHRHYVAATDRRLRESLDPNSPPLPPFHVSDDHRHPFDRLNVFLVVLNAEIKFRRYLGMAPPPIPLPVDVLHLMQRTIDLVDLLYWEPVPKKGSRGAAVVANRLARRRKNPSRDKRPDPETVIESPSEESITQETPIPSSSHDLSSPRGIVRYLADVDMETLKAYGRALMCGHDREYDPALFEDAIPLDDPHIYSEKTNVEAWQQGVVTSVEKPTEVIDLEAQ